MSITFRVNGIPKGQPRPRAFSRNGHARVYDPGTAEGWKSAIAAAALPHRMARPLDVPVYVSLTFYMPRPKSHYKRNGDLKADAPTWCASKPDLDNAEKCVYDALTEIGFWRDDALIVKHSVAKVYDRVGGMVMTIEALTGEELNSNGGDGNGKA